MPISQIKKTGGMKLFRSHDPDFGDGQQARDFIYVKDVVEVILFMMEKRPESGLYNLGTGVARTFHGPGKFYLSGHGTGRSHILY